MGALGGLAVLAVVAAAAWAISAAQPKEWVCIGFKAPGESPEGYRWVEDINKFLEDNPGYSARGFNDIACERFDIPKPEPFKLWPVRFVD